MHIAEGIITGAAAVGYTAAGLAIVGGGAVRMKKFIADHPEKKPLLGMGGALIFFISLIPIPAFTGTCSHPCGTPLIGILLGPLIGGGLAGISLLLQAAFFAHGGFGTWGANVVALGFFGCFTGWAVFRLARLMGLPLWAAGFAGGLIGDLMVYASSGFILGAALSGAATPQYSFSGYLVAIYAAYLPTQLPIAAGEMLITGLALQHAFNQRPEVLESLGIVTPDGKPRGQKILVLMLLPLSLALMPAVGRAAQEAGERVEAAEGSQETKDEARFAGMDEAVNERLAEAAGRPARNPYIDTENMGDLWNLLLLAAGGVCGFILGRWWHLLWGDQPKCAGDG